MKHVKRITIKKDAYLDAFQHLINDDNIDIELLWGGRDGAKSWTIAELFVEYGMSLKYFRAILIKQTHESIKDSQWQTIKDVVEDWHPLLPELFNFKTSPLEIICRNGNKYIARGMDNPAKIKSISNPSHAWIEEGNQISEESFITILTSLRSMFGNIKLYISFNPEATTPDYKEFWLYKMFFAKYEPQKNFTGEVVIKVGEEEIKLRYRSTHTTYHDNPYVTKQRRAIHESLQETNYYWYKVFTLGEWGNPLNDSPFAFAFDRKKHVGHCTLNRMEPLYLSWDFNRNPMCCNVIQHYNDHIYVLEIIKEMKAGVDTMCEMIKFRYPNCLYIVTGDYSGNNETSLMKEQITHYSLIQNYLNLSDGQLKAKPNPRLTKSSTHVNTILAYYKVTIDEEKAKPLIFDMENVRRVADGTIMKTNREDPAQQSDCLDGFRYFIFNFMSWFQPAI